MATIHLNTEPRVFGEQSILKELSSLSDDWHVFYSVGFLDRAGFDRQREIDFIAWHESRGLVFIEVKGGQVRFNNGIVSQYLGDRWQNINPVRQLNDARRVCLEYLRSKGVSEFIPAKNLYAFPTTPEPDSGLSQELSICSYFKNSSPVLAHQVASLLPNQPLKTRSDQVVNLLRACLTYDVSAESALSGEHALPVRKTTLVQVLSEGGSTFGSIESAKASLGILRESLQALWWKVVNSRSAIESAGGDVHFHQQDPLVQIMRETNNLLTNSAVEIGVFGHVKRGKSTLVNALIGREVLATGMRPKTAVPVTIEYSPEESGLVVLADGGTINASIEEAVEATTQQDRKNRIKNTLPLVDRVVIRLPLGWLESGVKVVDTPGLADPGLSEVYESYALAELTRVGAAVFVVSYPPGPAQHEVSLMASLASKGLAKVFFVVNTFPEIWRKKGAREDIAGYLREVIDGAIPPMSDLHADDKRVFVMNLKMATDGIRSGSKEKLSASGFLEFRDEIAEFLSSGALQRIAEGASTRLLRAAAVIEGTLKERSAAIKNPSHAQRMREELRTTIRDSSVAMDQIATRISSSIEKLTIGLEEIVSSGYATSLNSVSSTTNRQTLRVAVSRLPVESAAIASSLVNQIQRDLLPIVEEARLSLAKSLSVSSWSYTPNEAFGGLLATPEFVGVNVADYVAPSDHTPQVRSLAAVIGAMLGGGQGIALAATGPIGLVIGAILGYLAADGIGSFFKSPGNTHDASPAEVQKVIEAVRKAEADSRTALRATMKKIDVDLQGSLGNVRRNVLKDVEAELRHIESLLSDKDGRQRALDQILTFASELSEITGNKFDV
jgi:hypothetical protein